MNDESNKYYELLGVAPGTSGRELKQAYLDMAKVWHPDRFSHDPRLQQKAQEKLKEINEAYDLLTSGRSARRAHSPARPASPPAPARRGRWPLIVAAALIFGAVFFAASRALIPQGGTRPRTEPPAARTEPAAGGGGRPAEAEASAPERRARDEKRAERRDSGGATPPADPPREPAAEAPRPLPTVTLLIDPTTGLLATPDCPVRSRTTYASGHEPRRPCDAPHKGRPKAASRPEAPQVSRPASDSETR